jgi:hypothetical protein
VWHHGQDGEAGYAWHEAGEDVVPPRPRVRNYEVVTARVAERVAKTRGRISAKRLLPAARPAGYGGSARNLRRLVAAQKALWRQENHRGRRPAVWSPGQYRMREARTRRGGDAQTLINRGMRTFTWQPARTATWPLTDVTPAARAQHGTQPEQTGGPSSSWRLEYHNTGTGNSHRTHHTNRMKPSRRRATSLGREADCRPLSRSRTGGDHDCSVRGETRGPAGASSSTVTAGSAEAEGLESAS